MDTKLCRICGKLSENYVHIFKTEGLKNKIETCLPIIVSPLCLLPDTICSECLENVDNFYSFIKNCLQNIIVLEAQYDITESCLKTKRKHEKSCMTVDSNSTRHDKNVQTDEDFADLLSRRDALASGTFYLNYIGIEKLNTALTNAENILNGKEPEASETAKRNKLTLVNYEVADSDSEYENNGNNTGKAVIVPKAFKNKLQRNQHVKTNIEYRLPKRYFDDPENDLITEISQRKDLKRKNDSILKHRTKIFKMDTYSKRKSRWPKKVRYEAGSGNLTFDSLELICNKIEKEEEERTEDKVVAVQQAEKETSTTALPQLCLLCDVQFSGPTTLAAHVFEMHGIDMAQVLSSEPVMERKKKIPNLVKITSLKAKPESGDPGPEGPPTLQPTYVCPLCPAVSTTRSDLFAHLRNEHSKHAALMCGLCLHAADSYPSLVNHTETCTRQHGPTSKYVCKVCCYHDDNPKTMENHVTVHDFILALCKKQARMFDPCDYVLMNSGCEGAGKPLSCTECGQASFATFKEFSTHRRSQHQIFHCDLCNKFYGRNSHLWKHVNRLHKGHPSITCQLCYKTSASKYHLAQHFNKIHKRQNEEETRASFMARKFRGFDFQSVRQSFMRQELMERQEQRCDGGGGLSDTDGEENTTIKQEVVVVQTADGMEFSDSEDAPPPKEIDASSDLYTNIITNYTPPQNEGEYKCPKCLKGFHKKTLLKKHKKNCRPRLQKDLLTRCKTCSRIFKDRQSLTKHLINYHSEYACEICGQKVQSKCEIVSHIRFTHPGCHLVCHCGQILRSQTDLSEHRNDHRNSFVCQFCGDALPTKIKLKMHILSLHRKILSLSCGICLRLFETQHVLRDHVRLVHKSELSPLTSCTVCGKNYGSKWKTYDHLNKSHGRIFRACKACLDVFDTETELQAHLETNHAGMAQCKYGMTPVAMLESAGGVKSDEQNTSNSDFSNEDDEEDEDDYENPPTGDEEQQQRPPPPPPPPPKVNDLGGQENRISLLERRLLGAAGVVESSTFPFKNRNNNNNQQLQQQQKKISRIETDPELNCQQSPSQNSSKRTVYVNSNDPSLCEICLKTWPAKKHLWQHYIRCHKTVAATVCGICLKTNDGYESLQAHLQQTHPTLLHGQGFGSNFICRICGRYHNASSKLKLHMAIHENFDWSMLTEPRNVYRLAPDEAATVPVANGNGYLPLEGEEEEQQRRHHHKDKDAAAAADTDAVTVINYESLIEQIECSTDDDDEDSEVESKYKEEGGECGPLNSSTSEDSDDNNESEENSELESRMLRNMLDEKFTPATVTADDVKQEYSSSESEDSSESGDANDAVRIRSSSDDEQEEEGRLNTTGKMFLRKPEELDSAVRSISCGEQVADVHEQIDVDICEMQPQTLNQHEIQSAIDSIL